MNSAFLIVVEQINLHLQKVSVMILVSIIEGGSNNDSDYSKISNS